MKVWVVNLGPYYDYAVDGVFSTEELAIAHFKKVADQYQEQEFAIDEYTLDEGKFLKGVTHP